MNKTSLRILFAPLSALLLMAGCSTDNGINDDGTDEPTVYTVTVTDDGNGSAWGDLTEAEEGDSVTVEADPDDEYLFVQWVVVSGGVTLDDPTANPATFTMPADNVTIRAEFSDVPVYAVAVSADSDGGGSAQADKAVYKEGETVTIEAAPDEGYEFVKWTVTGGDITLEDDTANPATFIIPAAEVTIEASFAALPTYGVVVTVTGGKGGTAKADSEQYWAGATVTLTAVAAEGYAFAGWTVTEGEIEIDNEGLSAATFTMPEEEVAVSAAFVAVMPESNSYMVTTAIRELYIPVSQANRIFGVEGLGADTGDLEVVTADNFEVDLVWTEIASIGMWICNGSSKVVLDGRGYVRVNLSGTAGNCVVGIKVGDKWRWSWHIWVVGPSAVTEMADTVSGLTWMGRILGDGLYYQWGRKDAFKAQVSTSPSIAFTTGDCISLEDLVCGPDIFATNRATYTGSLGATDATNDSWGGVSGRKTIYDPCPVGWKVPPIEVTTERFTGFSWGESSRWDIFRDNGRRFHGVNGGSGMNAGLFFPAAGRRDSTDSTIGGTGTSGNYHSSTAETNSSYPDFCFLSFTNSYIRTSDNNSYRTSGYTVRCVKE